MILLAVNAANLVMGPATLYVAAFGASEPLDSAITPSGVSTPPGGSWVDVGGTDGGVNLEVDNTYTGLNVDQVLMEVGARQTAVAIKVSAKLAEMTLNNINQALNNIATVSQGAGYASMDLPVGTSATQPAYAALLIDGWAPMLGTGAPARRRVIVRKVLSQTKVTLTHDKKTQQSLDCSWSAYFVSGSIMPLHIVDQQA
jgi:hypothetical protein